MMILSWQQPRVKYSKTTAFPQVPTPLPWKKKKDFLLIYPFIKELPSYKVCTNWTYYILLYITSLLFSTDYSHCGFSGKLPQILKWFLDVQYIEILVSKIKYYYSATTTTGTTTTTTAAAAAARHFDAAVSYYLWHLDGLIIVCSSQK